MWSESRTNSISMAILTGKRIKSHNLLHKSVDFESYLSYLKKVDGVSLLETIF
jgi:hypothetical protein